MKDFRDVVRRNKRKALGRIVYVLTAVLAMCYLGAVSIESWLYFGLYALSQGVVYVILNPVPAEPEKQMTVTA